MHQLYRHFNADGELLYVGESRCAPCRQYEHKHVDWINEIANITIEHFPAREEALMAEREAIRTENPKYNMVRYSSGDATAPAVQMSAGEKRTHPRLLDMIDPAKKWLPANRGYLNCYPIGPYNIQEK
jgi:excinuclease UvrABC nuclease subunit